MNDDVRIKLQRMIIRAMVLIFAMVVLVILAFNEEKVNTEIVRIFEGITIAGAVFFFPDSTPIFSWLRNIRISRTNGEEK